MDTSVTGNGRTDAIYVVTSFVIILGYLFYFLLR